MAGPHQIPPVTVVFDVDRADRSQSITASLVVSRLNSAATTRHTDCNRPRYARQNLLRLCYPRGGSGLSAFSYNWCVQCFSKRLLTVDETSAVRNCNSDAGVVVVNGVSKVSIQDCHFSQNSATRYALLSNQIRSNLIGIIAQYSVAGALATSSSVVATVSGSTFSGNSGGAYGGGAYFAGQSIVNNCTFTGNTADSRGGGFACYSAAATVDLSFSNFTNNAAPQGSAYSCISGCTVVDDGNNILNGESANC